MRNEFENLKSVCFSGHRIVPFAKQNEIMRLLRNEITKSYHEGYRCFFCGMAIGFDLLSAKAVLSLKPELSQIKIIAVLPYREQTERWIEKNKVEYERILNEVDETIIVSEHYRCKIFFNALLQPCKHMIHSTLLHFAEGQKFVRGTDKELHFCKETHKICKNALFLGFLKHLYFVAWLNGL